jgi:hypothetical protein
MIQSWPRFWLNGALVRRMQRIRVMGFQRRRKAGQQRVQPDSLGGLANNVLTSSLCGELNPHGTRACACAGACVCLLGCYCPASRAWLRAWLQHRERLPRVVLILVLSSFHIHSLKRQRSDRLPRKATNGGKGILRSRRYCCRL